MIEVAGKVVTPGLIDLHAHVFEGVNRVKRHTKSDPNDTRVKTGGIITQEAAIHVSNVVLIDPDSKKPTKVGIRRNDEGKNVRVARRTGKDI